MYGLGNTQNTHPSTTWDKAPRAHLVHINGEHRTIDEHTAIQTLTQHWPALFPHGILRPLSVNIDEQLKADNHSRHLPLSEQELHQHLSLILHSVAYQATLMPGALRYTHTGQVEGIVEDNA
nr:ProQ/FINO family protein [Providencia rettgeri]